MEFFEIASAVEYSFLMMGDEMKRYLWAYLLIAGLCFAVLYVFQSIALYKIAVRDGFKRRWMAFVPFFNTYYIGVVSDKNKVFKAKTSYVSLAAAIVEAAYVALYILYYVATFLIFREGYAVPEYSVIMIGEPFEVLSGYSMSPSLPENLEWAWWVFANFQNYILYFVQLAYIILLIFVLVAFFRTYSSPRYVLFSILSVIFPLKGVFMFAVRNNAGKNYVDYMREQQQRQYRMYQEYMRNMQNGQNGQGGFNGTGGVNYGGTGADPYAPQGKNSPPDDPFGGLGAGASGDGTDGAGKNNGRGGDPFDDFK